MLPGDQDKKLAAIASAAKDLDPALRQPVLKAPSDAETVTALRKTAESLSTAVEGSADAETAERVVRLLTGLAEAPPETRERANAAFVMPLEYDLAWQKDALSPQIVTVDHLPAGLKSGWILPDGRARVRIEPKGSFSDGDVLKQFAGAILAAFPSATGPAISL